MFPSNTIRAVASGVADLIWPRRCWLCEADTTAAFCDPCRAELTTDTGPTCPRCCGTVGPHVDLTDGCLQCRDSHFHFDAAVRLGVYGGRLRDAILRLKHEPGEPLAEELGSLLVEQQAGKLAAYQLEVVVPIPLHWLRRWSRGYNQSEAVARVMANRLGLPCRSLLVRTRPTPSQQARSAAARRENVRGAFRVRRGVAVSGSRVLLVDDVMTTGATADAAATALRQAGAAQVAIAILARR